MQYAFVDESGNSSLNVDVPGTPIFFIVVAVLVRGDRLAEAERVAEEVRRAEFQTGEMKSAGVSGDDRRLRILKALSEAPMKFLALIVDKRHLRKDGGFIYRQPFMKYMNGRVYNTIYRAYDAVHVVADRHGRPEFMSSFEKYMASRHMDNLFASQSFEFVDSKSNVLVQVADMIAGTLARIYEPDRECANSEELLSLLGRSAIEIEHFPYGHRDELRAAEESGEADQIIRELSKHAALRFIEENNQDEDPIARMQVGFVRYLLYVYRQRGPSEFVSTDEILEHIGDASEERTTVHYFRTHVVAKVRDQGVIVASGKKGYKIPYSLDDLLSYVGHADLIIRPMLRRLREARKQILLASNGGCDILNGDEFAYLKAAIEARKP